MINALTGIGYGLVAFAVVIGIGVTVLGTLSSTISACGTGYTYQSNGSATFSTGLCCLSTGAKSDCASIGNYTNPNAGTTVINTINGTYIGTNLVGWIPVIIVLVIGMLFLGAFLTKKGKQS